MDDFFRNIADPFSDAWLRQVVEGAMRYFFAFTLVVTRMSGLVSIGPVFGHPDIPLQIRVLLVLSLSFLVTPLLLGVEPRETFRRLDSNHDGRLSVEEAPPQLQGQVAALLRQAGKGEDDSLAAGEFHLALPLPKSAVDYAWLAVAEFGLGLALGLGVLTIISGLQLAGYLIDQQTGVSLGEVFNPELETSASLTGEILHWLGTALFLLVGGHTLLVSALVDTFQTLPVGDAFVSAPAIDLLRDLVHQSFALAIQVSAPIMATMAMVGLSMGFLGHTIPQINVLVVGFPVRIIIGLLVFGLALSGIGEAITGQLPATIAELKRTLMGG